MEQITSRENPHIKQIIRLLSARSEREKTNQFVVEGVRLCLDAHVSGIKLCEVYATQKALDKHPQLMQLVESADEAFMIPDGVAEKISETKSPQGVFLICEKRHHQRPKVHALNARYIILASLQDPGNVGTIIRTAEAFNLDGVVLSADCPELYSPKVLRAAMGGVFRLPIWITDNVESEVEELKSEGVTVFAAALKKDAQKLGDVCFKGANAILLGNEGAGLDSALISVCSEAIMIPMAGRADSLGVANAAGVFAWEMTK